MHYYSHNIGDYAQATSHLSLIEDAVYTRLLRRYYAEETPIVNDMQQVSRWVGAKSDEERAAVPVILSEFFELKDGFWHNKRADEEICAYHKKAEANRNNGKRGGRPKNKPTETQSVNSGLANETQSVNSGLANETQSVNSGLANETHEDPSRNLNHKPLTINQEPIDKDIKDMSANADTDQVITIEDHQDHQEQQERKPTTDNRVIEIFHYWCDAMRKNRLTAKMTPKRTKAIRDRLKQGYTMDDIKLAIYNCSQDPWSMGNNDRQKPFNDIELICRSGEKLESYLDAVQQKAAARNVNSIGTDFSPPKGWNT